MNLIESAYSKYELQVFPLDRSPEKYKDMLINEIPLSSTKPISIFLKENVSDEHFKQISNSIEQKNDNTLYNAFIADTVVCVYDILTYKENTAYYKSVLFQIFNEILDEFLYKKSIQTRTNIKQAIEHQVHRK